MKFLDNLPELELLSQALSFSSPTLKVITRIEAFSCKPISRERKLFKTLEQDMVSDMELTASVSPPDFSSSLDSAFGPLNDRQNRKTLYMLKATLNLAFPDFDFSSVPPEAFNREPSASAVLSSLSNALNHLRSSAASTTPSLYRSFSSYTVSGSSTMPAPDQPIHGLLSGAQQPTHPFLKQILDPIINLAECQVYSYTPDVESDPHAAESELGSVPPSEVDDNESQLSREDSIMWPMDGIPAISAPPTPVRKLRSGNYYLTTPLSARGGLARRAVLGPSRSRSQTPATITEEEENSTTGGFLWSCNYFFYNKQRKRILFISHHMKRISAAGGIENYPTGVHQQPIVGDMNGSKRRASQSVPTTPDPTTAHKRFKIV